MMAQQNNDKRIVYKSPMTDKEVLKAISNNPLKSRSELVDITGIPRSTIYDAILRLMD
jgi:hypothetical protein